MQRSLSVVLLSFPLLAQGWVDRTPANPAAGPSARAFPAMCWDGARNQVLMFGGTPNGGGATLDTWIWNGAAWSRRTTPTTPTWTGYAIPQSNGMTFHAPTAEVVMVVQGNTYTWEGTDWTFRGPVPESQWGTPGYIALGHDPTRNQTVMFVPVRNNNGSIQFRGETFVWDGFAWSPRITPVTPYPYQQPSMAFDPVSSRLVLATSGNGQSAYFEWTGSNWQQRLPAGAPAAAGAMATDSANQRIVMLDGVLNAQPGHTWTLSNGTMASVASPLEPARRLGAGMVFDPVRNRIVLFGGANYFDPNFPHLTVPLGDTWEFTLGAPPAYTTFGTGCAGSRGVVTLGQNGSSLPRIGQNFELHVGNLPFTGPAFLFLGISNTNYGPTPLPFALGGLGAPNCSILCSGDELSLLTNVLGSAVWQRTIPVLPGLVFYNQAFALDPAANTLGLTASNGGRATVGF